jgi:hypothetical protein
MCNCPSSANEIERMKSDVFLLDRELQRENRRAREFSGALQALASGVNSLYHKNLCEDDLWLELSRLDQQAAEAAELLAEPRNQDRVHELMKRIESAQEQGESNG